MKTSTRYLIVGALLVLLAVAVGVFATSNVWALNGVTPNRNSGQADDSIIAQAAEPDSTDNGVEHAIAVLHPTEGNTLSGVVTFEKVEDGIHIVARVDNLSPGDHGFHIYEYGDCSAPDASSAGEHFNPERESHGGPMSAARHVGDLGNIRVDEQGHGSYDWVDTVIAFDGSHSIIGRSVVISAEADDFTSQPDGSIGGRLACGVIGIAASE